MLNNTIKFFDDGNEELFISPKVYKILYFQDGGLRSAPKSWANTAIDKPQYDNGNRLLKMTSDQSTQQTRDLEMQLVQDLKNHKLENETPQDFITCSTINRLGTLYKKKFKTLIRT